MIKGEMKKKNWNRKRPAVTFTLTEGNKMLIDTLALQAGKTRSSILDSLLSYIVIKFNENPEEVMKVITD